MIGGHDLKNLFLMDQLKISKKDSHLALRNHFFRLRLPDNLQLPQISSQDEVVEYAYSAGKTSGVLRGAASEASKCYMMAHWAPPFTVNSAKIFNPSLTDDINNILR